MPKPSEIEFDMVKIARLASRLNRTLGLNMDREDAVQEAYLVGFTASESFRGESNINTFVTRAVVNHFINLRKKASRSVHVLDIDITELEEAVDVEVDGPQKLIEELEIFEKFLELLKSVDSELKYIVHQRVNNETAFADIARELKQPVNNVKVKMHRMIKRFKKDLGI